MNNQLPDILTVYEAEHYIEAIQIYEINELGCKKWFAQDEMIQKLNMQAHINAMMRSDEFIMEACCTFDKVKPLIYDLIMTEMWKQYVYPILKNHLSDIPSIRSYTVLQHEAIVCNLLQICFFHRTAIESADGYILEIVDYTYRKLAALLQKPLPKKIEKKTPEYYKNRTKIEEIDEQFSQIEFQIQMMCLSIIRFITDHIKHLPINTLHQIVVENDFLLLLIPLIEEKPWLRINSNNEREIFEHQKWTVINKEEYSKLPKVEAQLWITIYNLFMDPECRRKYELNEYKKSNLLRLRKYMNELLLDQIPQLVDLLRSLEELSIMQVQSQSKTTIVVQQLPELRLTICKDKNWKQIAEKQKTEYFQVNDQNLKEDIKRIAELYSNSVFDGLVDGFKCEICQKEAVKRCSRCKKVWYCSQDCQKVDWPNHKQNCQQQQKQEIQGLPQTTKINEKELDQLD